jgi:hypothetical protein
VGTERSTREGVLRSLFCLLLLCRVAGQAEALCSLVDARHPARSHRPTVEELIRAVGVQLGLRSKAPYSDMRRCQPLLDLTGGHVARLHVCLVLSWRGAGRAHAAARDRVLFRLDEGVSSLALLRGVLCSNFYVAMVCDDVWGVYTYNTVIVPPANPGHNRGCGVYGGCRRGTLVQYLPSKGWRILASSG